MKLYLAGVQSAPRSFHDVLSDCPSMVSVVHRRLVLFHRTEQRLNRPEHSRIERGNDAGLHCEAWQRAQVRRMASAASVP